MIREIKMPTQIRIRGLRAQIQTCERHGTNTVLIGDRPHTLEYARHVLACLLEAHADKPCPSSGWESLTH